MKKKLLLPAIALLSAILLTGCATSDDNATTTTDNVGDTEESLTTEELNDVSLPQLENHVGEDEYLVEMETTEGNIQIRLFPKYAPLAVENFVTHAKNGFYDGTIFHRVIEEFMIQGGDPEGTGMGGQSIWRDVDPEIDGGTGFPLEITPNLYNIRGALSMANTGQPNSNGSQFFINTNPNDMSSGLAIQWTPERIIEAYREGGNPGLDGRFTVFGQVYKGMDVVEKIAGGEVEASAAGEQSSPVNPVKVTHIRILQEPSN